MPKLQQGDDTFNELSQIIWKHLEERDWLDNDARSLATSISLEASELLEHYQWNNSPVGSKEELAEELADILIYAFQFAQKHDIDMSQAIRKKLAKAAKKYPAEQFKGKDAAARRASWIDSKVKHRKDGL